MYTGRKKKGFSNFGLLSPARFYNPADQPSTSYARLAAGGYRTGSMIWEVPRPGRTDGLLSRKKCIPWSVMRLPGTSQVLDLTIGEVDG
jgi:hypothetical protein